MGRFLICLCLQRILLPISLIIGCILRQNGMSFIYLILLLYNPIVPVPTVTTIAGHAGRYLKTVIFFTVLNAIAQFAFQIVLLANPRYGDIIEPVCGQMERWLRYAGLVRLDDLNALDVVRILTPEVVMLAASILVFVVCRALNRPHSEDDLLPVVGIPPDAHAHLHVKSRRKHSLLTVLVQQAYTMRSEPLECTQNTLIFWRPSRHHFQSVRKEKRRVGLLTYFFVTLAFRIVEFILCVKWYNQKYDWIFW